MLNSRLNDRLHVGNLVVLDPVRQADLSGLHVTKLDGISAKEVGHHSQVAIVGELVGKQLAVDEETEDVGKEEDGFLGVLVVLGGGDVGLDCYMGGRRVSRWIVYKTLKVLLTTVNVLGLANWGTFMLEASGTASSGGVGRHFQQERSRSSIYKMVV